MTDDYHTKRFACHHLYLTADSLYFYDDFKSISLSHTDHAPLSGWSLASFEFSMKTADVGKKGRKEPT